MSWQKESKEKQRLLNAVLFLQGKEPWKTAVETIWLRLLPTEIYDEIKNAPPEGVVQAKARWERPSMAPFWHWHDSLFGIAKLWAYTWDRYKHPQRFVKDVFDFIDAPQSPYNFWQQALHNLLIDIATYKISGEHAHKRPASP